MNTRIAALISAVAVALLTGCQTARPLYFWGNYAVSILSGKAND